MLSKGKGKTCQEILQLLKTLKMLIRSLRQTVSCSSGTAAASAQGSLAVTLRTAGVFILTPEAGFSFSTKDQTRPYKIPPLLLKVPLTADPEVWAVVAKRKCFLKIIFSR